LLGKILPGEIRREFITFAPNLLYSLDLTDYFSIKKNTPDISNTLDRATDGTSQAIFDR